MEKRSLFEKIFGKTPVKTEGKRFELVDSINSSFVSWDGNNFNSDIIRSAVRPIANAVGKLQAKHFRGKVINPDAYISKILGRPNIYMSMQDFLTKMIFQRELTGNAFAYVQTDAEGYPVAIYPIPFSNVELLEVAEDVFAKFRFRNGKNMTVPYTSLIHLRKDFFNNDFYGESGNFCLRGIMEVINTTDQSIVNAVRTSATLKWIMKFKAVLKPEDRDLHLADFVKNFLTVSNSGGAAATDPRYDLEQVDEKSYVPNSAIMDKSVQRLYSYFGVNQAIVQNSYTEDQWLSFYEAVIEPIVIQLSNAFTSVFFTERERGYGNKIVFDSNSLSFASMSTKLQLVQFLDRGIMNANEIRKILNFSEVDGGDEFVRRLDTVPITVEEVKNDESKPESEPEPEPEPGGKTGQEDNTVTGD